MKIIKISLVLNTPIHFSYSDGTYVEYMITENPFDSGSYAVHVSFGSKTDKAATTYMEVYFPRHSTLSREYSVNGKMFKLRLVGKQEESHGKY